jgi:hypothetical protein
MVRLLPDYVDVCVIGQATWINLDSAV